METAVVFAHGREDIAEFLTLGAFAFVRIEIENRKRSLFALAGALAQEEIILDLQERVVLLERDHFRVVNPALLFHIGEALGEVVDLLDQECASGHFTDVTRGVRQEGVLDLGLQDILPDVLFHSLDLRDALGVEVV